MKEETAKNHRMKRKLALYGFAKVARPDGQAKNLRGFVGDYAATQSHAGWHIGAPPGSCCT